MRIHAIDCSGSFYVYQQKAFRALRNHAKGGDLIVLFDQRVGKVRRWEDVLQVGHEAIRDTIVSGKIQTIYEWMEGRFISQHDTLIVYSDYCDHMPEDDTFFRTEFVCFSQMPGQKFFNSNVFRVGEYNEGYRVLPWPDHPALTALAT